MKDRAEKRDGAPKIRDVIDLERQRVDSNRAQLIRGRPIVLARV